MLAESKAQYLIVAFEGVKRVSAKNVQRSWSETSSGCLRRMLRIISEVELRDGDVVVYAEVWFAAESKPELSRS